MLSGIVLAVALSGNTPATAITGGTDVTTGTLPFVARLDLGTTERSCTGVLVHPQVVLTAAVCFAGPGGTTTTGTPPLATKVTVGGAVSTVSRIVAHPTKNLVLARLDSTITTVAPVPIASTAPAAGDLLTLAGFGRTGTEWIPGRLKAAEFTVRAAGTATFDVAPSGTSGAGVCRGDSGGPALKSSNGTYQLVGLHHSSNQAGCVGEPSGTPAATETRIDTERTWVTDNLPGFASGLETADVRPNWQNTVGPAGSANIIGACCSLTAPELGVRPENPHSGSNTLMYSGKDNSATLSYAYLKAFGLRNTKLRAGSVLSYWIYPQSSTTSSAVSGSNSTCVAVDLAFVDGSNLRDSGALDQRGNSIHPGGQCGKLTLDTWNQVIVPIGTLRAGRQIDTLSIGYDQAVNTGGYRGYVDDIRITDVLESPQFASGLETGETAPTWTNTVSAKLPGAGGGLAEVGGLCCAVTIPELGSRAEQAATGTNALMYSGRDNSTSTSYAYLKAFQLNEVYIKPTTKLTYRIFPQSTATNSAVSGSNSTCVSVDLLFVDQWDAKKTNMRDTTEALDQKGDRAHPTHQCGKLTMDAWNEVTISLGAVNGKQITELDVGYDQALNSGGYRGYIDDIRITE
ncbi:hypothetical protein Q0Z83_080500 [Actinoplanes sichuanensis]|nr:hypothetical protein Q0Z83_080500 [Actinoplanes sichuanensis]